MKECTSCNRCYLDEHDRCSIDNAPLLSSLLGPPILDNRYQLERRLGKGGMGIVYKARHVFLKTERAIKIILPELVGNDPVLTTRFRQEAMAAAAIRHRNIVAVTDYGVVGENMPFLVMEYIKGRSLHDVIAQEGRLPFRRAFEIMEAIGAGVEAAHRRDIVHRDLKPLNIMLQDGMPISEAVKLLDFGLAKIKSNDLLGSFVVAKTAGIMGSPFYMAPEQWEEEELDIRADIYSLGIIFYQMLAGEVPYKGQSLPAVMNKHLTGKPPSLASLGVQVPAQVESAIAHALEKDPAKRPRTITEFVEELRRAGLNPAPEVILETPADAQADTVALSPRAPGKQPASAKRDALNDLMQQAVADVERLGKEDDGVQTAPKRKGRTRAKAKSKQLRPEEVQPAEASPDGAAEELRQSVEREAARKRADRAAALREAKERRQREEQEEAARLAAEARQRAEAEALQQREAEARARSERERESAVAPQHIEPPPPSVANIPAPVEHKAVSTQRMSLGAATQVAGSNTRLPPTPPQSDWQASFSSLYNSASGFIATQKTPFLLFTGGVVVVIIFLIGVAGASLYIWLKSSNGPASASSAKPAYKAEMAAIPGGTFQMGRSDVSGDALNQYPAHAVKVAPFLMDKTEVTNAEYAQFVRETNYAAPPHWANNQPPAGQEQWPVTNVSYLDALAFAAWRSKRDGVQYRLPTEEEWEYAARDGEASYLYPWGPQWRSGVANLDSNSPKPVGSYPQGASAWGVQDLIGNVWEWTSSKNSLYPGIERYKDIITVAPDQQDWIVTRGSSYKDKTSNTGSLVASRRKVAPASTKHETLGFRLVRSGS